MTENAFEVVQHGRWAYAEGIRGHVWIVRQRSDFYHEDFYDEPPQVNADGNAYYVLYGLSPRVAEHSSRSRTCLSEREAMDLAAATLNALEWDE